MASIWDICRIFADRPCWGRPWLIKLSTEIPYLTSLRTMWIWSIHGLIDQEGDRMSPSLQLNWNCLCLCGGKREFPESEQVLQIALSLLTWTSGPLVWKKRRKAVKRDHWWTWGYSIRWMTRQVSWPTATTSHLTVIIISSLPSTSYRLGWGKRKEELIFSSLSGCTKKGQTGALGGLELTDIFNIFAAPPLPLANTNRETLSTNARKRPRSFSSTKSRLDKSPLSQPLSGMSQVHINAHGSIHNDG